MNKLQQKIIDEILGATASYTIQALFDVLKESRFYFDENEQQIAKIKLKNFLWEIIKNVKK